MLYFGLAVQVYNGALRIESSVSFFYLANCSMILSKNGGLEIKFPNTFLMVITFSFFRKK